SQDTTAQLDNFGGGTSTQGLGLTVNGNTLLQSTTNSTTTFQVQGASGTSLLTADTTDLQVNAGGDLNVGTNFGQRLYSDNFESGSLALWTSQTASGGTATIDTTHAHDGKYAAKVSEGGGTAQIYSNIASTSTVDFRGYFYMTSLPTSIPINFIKLYTSSAQTDVLSAYMSTSGYLCIYHTTGTTGSCSTTSVPLNQWNKIEVIATAGASGSVSITLNNSVISSLTETNVAITSGGSWVQVGSGNSSYDPGSNGTMWVDDISVDTTATGNGQSLNVSDTLHVSGNATFGNSLLVQTNSNSTTAFQVQNAAGDSALTVDTTNQRVDVGTVGTPTGQLYVSG
ncbi:MAG: hypothetical protein ACREHG_04365, partial [Candidatus Saccharimonadales bacterium]